MKKIIYNEKSEALYKLAQTKNLPLHQFMDKETLLWIEKNCPEEFKNTKHAQITNYYKNTITKPLSLLPKHTWYAHPSIVSSIHGVLHSYRVAVYALILNDIFAFNLDEDIVIMAGLFHDMRRYDDKGDEGHEQRVAHWLTNNRKEVISACHLKKE